MTTHCPEPPQRRVWVGTAEGQVCFEDDTGRWLTPEPGGQPLDSDRDGDGAFADSIAFQAEFTGAI